MNFEKVEEISNTLATFMEDMIFLAGISLKEDLEFSELVLCYENQVKNIKGEENEFDTIIQ